MTEASRAAGAAGADNLLLGCIGLEAGERLALICEDGGLGYYDDQVAAVVAARAEKIGAQVETVVAPLIQGPEDLPSAVAAAMAAADHTVFFHRLGDQIRFTEISVRGTVTMCYALDVDFLGSGFCTLPHELMSEIKARLEGALGRARTWRITCPLGTDVSGSMAAPIDDEPDDFTLGLFPEVTFRPVSCADMSGRVAVAHWLMGTGTHAYEPFALMLDAPVLAEVDQGRIRGFTGRQDLADAVDAHYRRVGGLFDLDRDVVHSWHAGINPQSYYSRPAVDDLERWGGVAFANPRYLHFHTCGDYAPGEIAWSLFDASVWIDDEMFWRGGRLVWLDSPEIRDLAARYPGGDALYRMREDIGI